MSYFKKLLKNSEYEDLEGDNSGEEKVALQYQGTDQNLNPLYTSQDKDHGETFTIGQAIDQVGFGPFQVKLSILTGIAWMADAMEMMILAVLGPAVHCEWALTGFQEAAITTMVFCGMACSSSLWGRFSDSFGRKTELVLCSLVTCYFGILSSFSPSLLWLLILRGLVGFGIGGAPQAVTLYAEFLPAQWRAVCVTLMEMFWAVGACFEVLLAIVVMPRLGWRWLLVVSSAPLLFFAISCVWLPESARYHLIHGQNEEAFQILQRVADENGRSLPPGKLVAAPNEDVEPGSTADLLKPGLRTSTLLLWIIWFVSAFCYYGIVLLTTALFENPDGCHGTDVVTREKESCFLDCHFLTREDLQGLIWTTLAEFPGLFLAVFLLENIGRRFTMAFQFAGYTVFVLLVNLCSTRALLTTFLFAARAFISGAFQGVYVYTPEVYPTALRSMGLGVCSGMARVGATITPFFAQVLLQTSSFLAITIYAVICIAAVIAALLLPLETKGRELK